MENFFDYDKFFSDIGDLADEYDINEDNVNDLNEDWRVKVELSKLEPIFKVTAESLCQLLADRNEDRLSEDFDEEPRVLKAIKESIDFNKLQELLPKLYYPNGEFEVIKKADLIEWFA